MTLDELLYKLKNLTYKSEVLGTVSDYPIIRKEHFDRVENLIREFALDNHDAELGEMKAKLKVYEQIIAKSNFAPLILNTDVNEEAQND